MWPWSRSGVMLNARDCARFGNRDRGLNSERDGNSLDFIDFEEALRHLRARLKVREVVAAILDREGIGKRRVGGMVLHCGGKVAAARALLMYQSNRQNKTSTPNKCNCLPLFSGNY